MNHSPHHLSANAAAQPMVLPPLSLYIHIPWCVQKCPYCDFNSHGQQGELPQQEYVDALLKDLDADLHYVQNRPLHSIFIGGGTLHCLMLRKLPGCWQGSVSG